MPARPLIVIDPQPRAFEEIFEPKIWARLEELGELAIHEGPGRMPAGRLDSYLPEMALLIGQSDMPKSRLDRAPKLRAIINVETNFLQNVDYDACFERGVHVLAPGSAFARPVAEMALGMAIDLCRGVTAADRAMRAGHEKWLLEGAEGCFSLYGARVGLIGFGDLARAFVPLLQPFGCPVKAYDPWVSDHFMAGFGVAAASLEEVLTTSQVIVVFAAVTSDNQGFLGRREFEMIAPGSVFLLMSRAGVVDFLEFLRQVESGCFLGRDGCLSARARAARRSRAQSRGSASLAAPRRRDDRIALRDRPADRRGRRSHPARPAAALLPARAARDTGAVALEADRAQLTVGEAIERCGERPPSGTLRYALAYRLRPPPML